MTNENINNNIENDNIIINNKIIKIDENIDNI